MNTLNEIPNSGAD